MKNKAFALRIINLYRHLCDEHKEYVLSKQILKSGTSIGANVKEGVCGQSKADFYAKFYKPIKKRMKPCIGLNFSMKAVTWRGLPLKVSMRIVKSLLDYWQQLPILKNIPGNNTYTL